MLYYLQNNRIIRSKLSESHFRRTTENYREVGKTFFVPKLCETIITDQLALLISN